MYNQHASALSSCSKHPQPPATPLHSNLRSPSSTHRRDLWKVPEKRPKLPEDVQVHSHGLQNVRPLDFDGHRLPGVQPPLVHLALRLTDSKVG